MISHALAHILLIASTLCSANPESGPEAKDATLVRIKEKISETLQDMYGLTPADDLPITHRRLSLAFEAPHLVEERKAREFIISCLFDISYIIENEPSNTTLSSVYDSFRLTVSFYGPNHTRPTKPYVGAVQVNDVEILYRYFAKGKVSHSRESFDEALARTDQQSVEDFAAYEDVIMQVLDEMIEEHASQ